MEGDTEGATAQGLEIPKTVLACSCPCTLVCPGTSVSWSLGLSFPPDQEEGVVLGEIPALRGSQIVGSGALSSDARASQPRGP